MESEKDHLERITKWWDEKATSYYPIHRTKEVIGGIIENPKRSFHPVTYELIRKYIPDLFGKRVLVPSSGDNHAVYSFHLMGAQVTSADISQCQIDGAASVALQHGWDIEFVRDNTMVLEKLSDNDYDFVYTSNGVHVWISNLKSMYERIYRVLKKSGIYIMYDIHPFMRPFEYVDGEQPRIIKPYTEVVPHYHWRMQDLLNTMIQSGFRILQIEEMSPEDGRYWDASYDLPISDTESARLCDWRQNPMAALPQLLSVCIQKE